MALINNKTHMKSELQASSEQSKNDAWDINPYDFVSDPSELDRQEVEAVKQGFADAKAGRTLTRDEMRVKLKEILKQ